MRRCRTLTRDANELEREMAPRVAGYAPQLLELKGCGALIAGKIIGETGGVGRFRNDAQFARLAGVAPMGPPWTPVLFSPIDGSTDERARSFKK